jgi:hypothetical protein
MGARSLASLPAEAAHRGALVVLKGTIAAAVALEEEAWLTRALRFCPASWSGSSTPMAAMWSVARRQQLLAVQDLIEIRNLLNGAA